MKSFNIFAMFLLLILTCKGQEPKKEIMKADPAGLELIIFGAKIDPTGSISKRDMALEYGNMSVTDTVRTKFATTVKKVCQVKGCWMKVGLKDGYDVMVRFKDYGFFVPKDIQGRDVVINGLAFVEEMSIEDQRHFAQDAGKSKKEIEKIKKPIKTYSFEANGVLLKE